MSVLIHIGYPKAGSTFLQHWFNAHPDIFFDTHFLYPYSQTGIIAKQQQPDLKGKKHFVISEEQLVLWQGQLDIVGIKFKPFDIKTRQRQVAESLYRDFPQAKVLIVTRGYESMLKSMYSQYVTIGGILSFNAYQQEMGKHLAAFYDYSYVINLYRGLFKPENVIVLPFELLQTDNTAFMDLLLANTGFSANDSYQYQKVNASVATGLFEGYRLLSKIIYTAIKLLPPSVQAKIYRAYVNKLSAGKFPAFIKLLARVTRPANTTICKATLEGFAGKASLLKNETLYQPYNKEYLI